MTRILILCTNPNKDSFNSQLAATYQQAALETGHEVELVHLIDLDFAFNLLPGLPLEDDLKQQQEIIRWCEHLVVFCPVWWSNMPPLMSAYFDRVMTPNFAYDYPHPWPVLRIFIPRRLLKGRSARLVTTQDSFRFVSWLLGNPFGLTIRVSNFWYIGFWPTRITAFTRVLFASDDKRQRWHRKVAKLGRKGR